MSHVLVVVEKNIKSVAADKFIKKSFKELNMSELEIAIRQVLPTLINDYGFNKDCIEGYGRVPIQVGNQLVWADFVCYYYKNNTKIPFCIVEVKECRDNEVNFAIPQAESYAQRINAPFFCCTNGNIYNWFMTGNAQGHNIELSGVPTLPQKEYLKKPEKLFISTHLFEAISNFENGIKKEGHIYEDSLIHNNQTNMLCKALWNDNILHDSCKMIKIIQENTIQSRGKSEYLGNIRENYNHFIRLVNWLKDKNTPIQERIERANGKKSEYGIVKGGLFFITQLLAALYPMQYTVIEKNAIKGMMRFNLLDINLGGETAKEYLLFNDICLQVFPYFENIYHFNLSYVHNFFWHYESEFLKYKEWK